MTHNNSNMDYDNDLIKVIENLVGKKPSSDKLSMYKKALTHKSINQNENFETLEFLGDRVISLIIADFLFKLNKGEFFFTAGDMHNSFASFTNENAQAVYFDKLHLERFIKYQKNYGPLSNKVKADFVEAFIGAIYIDVGITRVIKLLNKIVLKITKKYNSFCFITEKELKLRKIIKNKFGKDLIIKNIQLSKTWKLETELKNQLVSCKNLSIVEARKELVGMLLKIYGNTKD